MIFINEKDDITSLEVDVKNKFRWEWLQINDASEEKIATWCKKIDVPGACFCTCCNTQIRYATSGLKALLKHSQTSNHQKTWKSVCNTQILHALHPSVSEELPANRTVDLATRKCRADALITTFVAENSLPFSVAPDILDLAKFLAKDVTALNSVQMSRSTATYKLKYGVAKTIKDEQIEILKKTFFSLNVDGATNKASESILTILVQFFCDKQQEVILRHLASIKLNTCTSDSIYNAIVSFFEENDIPWNNLISVLMDSCNTMRGVKNGVEVQIRSKKTAHLLDIDGDTCHTVNNCVKKFTEPFLKHLEILCDNIYFDLKSSDKRELFFELSDIIGIKPLKPLSRPDHRWLYVLPVLDRIQYLWDVLILFYFTWIPKDDIELYQEYVMSIYKERKLSESQVADVEKIQSLLKKKVLTEDGRKRKQRIIMRLFEQQKKTLLQYGIYKEVLPHFNSYLKLFQSQSIALHLIHIKLYSLTKHFMAYFIKHEILCEAESIEKICQVNVKDTSNYLPDELIFTGVDAMTIIKKSKKTDPITMEFKKTLKTAYSRCAAYMLLKLPLKNSNFIKFTGLDPELRGKTATFLALRKLAESLPNVIVIDELSNLDKEVRLYQTDTELNLSVKDDVEKFWVTIFNMRDNNLPKYPVLTKLVKAVLTCFHGPHVEGAFNHMGNIMTSNRLSLNEESLDCVQAVKYYLLSKKATTCDVFGSNNPMEEPIDKAFGSNLLKSRSHYHNSLAKKNTTLSKPISDQLDKKPVGTVLEKTCDAIKIISSVEQCVLESTAKRPHSPEKSSKRKQTKIAAFFSNGKL